MTKYQFLQQGRRIFKELRSELWDDMQLASHDRIAKVIICANHFLGKMGGHLIGQ